MGAKGRWIWRDLSCLFAVISAVLAFQPPILTRVPVLFTLVPVLLARVPRIWRRQSRQSRLALLARFPCLLAFVPRRRTRYHFPSVLTYQPAILAC